MLLINLIPTGIKNSDLTVMGSVEDVIAGKIRPDLKTTLFEANEYQFGFELASPHSIESMGESVLVNGYCYTTSTDKADHYLKTIAGKLFYTSGIFLVPKTAKPSYRLAPAKVSDPMTYFDFCKKIHAATGGPCLITALVRFKYLESTCIQKAPIYGQNIFEQAKEYYHDLKMQFNDCYFFLVAAIADFKNDSKKITDQMKVVLYHNPFDESNALNIHTHGLILNRRVSDVRTLVPKDVAHTVHLYTENTALDEIIWGEVFVVGSVSESVSVRL